MCDCNRLHLTDPKRCDVEDHLWDFYWSIPKPTKGVDDGGYRYEMSFDEKVELAMEMFPLKKPTQWNLTVSHSTRKRINKNYNERDAEGRTDKVWIEKSKRPSPNEPQEF